MHAFNMQIIETNKTNRNSGHDPTISRRALARVPERYNVLLTLGNSSPRYYVDGKVIASCPRSRAMTLGSM